MDANLDSLTETVHSSQAKVLMLSYLKTRENDSWTRRYLGHFELA
jgi:hypothetical protein